MDLTRFFAELHRLEMRETTSYKYTTHPLHLMIKHFAACFHWSAYFNKIKFFAALRQADFYMKSSVVLLIQDVRNSLCEFSGEVD